MSLHASFRRRTIFLVHPLGVCNFLPIPRGLSIEFDPSLEMGLSEVCDHTKGCAVESGRVTEGRAIEIGLRPKARP